MNSGDKIYHLLSALRNTSSRNEKTQIIGELASFPEGLYVLRQTYNPFITYGLKPPKLNEDVLQHGISFEPFLVDEFLKSLASRKLTGRAAEAECFEVMEALNGKGRHILWHILSKDLKCGVASKIINEAVPGLIPTFCVMRASHYEEKRIKSWPVKVELKLDGQRTTFICRENNGGFFTRSGKVVPALDFMVQPLIKAASVVAKEDSEVAAIIGKSDNLNFMLDGEAMMGLFEDTGILRRIGEDARDAELHLYDILSYDDFIKPQSAGADLMSRRSILQKFVQIGRKALPFQMAKMLQIVPQYIAYNDHEVQKLFSMARSMTLARYLARGDKSREEELSVKLIDKATNKPKVMEGLVVKVMNAQYDKKKSFNWLKVKAEETEDLRIVDAFSGEPHTKYENCLGGLIVDHNGVQVRVGGGFSDIEREQLWKLYQADQKSDVERQLIGRLIEVEFNEVTPDGSLRHPRFVRFRDDKDGEVEQEAA